MDFKEDEFTYAEKYRPTKIDDCILPKDLKDIFRGFVNDRKFPSLLLSGDSGIGKTTVAKALCDEIGADYIFINASNEGRNIDILRTRIQSFATTESMSMLSEEDAPLKVVIMDEADGMNSNSLQQALRSFMEDYSSHCVFIFTCNFKNNIIKAIHSRCFVIDFKIGEKDKVDIQAEFFSRVQEILKNEGVEYEKEVVAELIMLLYPDFRNTLYALQGNATSGRIDKNILSKFSSDSFNELVGFMKKKKIKDVRKWLAQNPDIDDRYIYRNLYERCWTELEPETIPEFILILGQYQYYTNFVADKEINTMCCLIEIMKKCRFK